MPKTEVEEVQELVVVGSGGVGKSCLTVRFLKDEFTNDYDPTIEENYRKHITVDASNCTVNIIDTAGQHEYTALRDQHLKDGKGFLLVFAVNDKHTFEEVKQLREQIVKLKDTKRVPLVVCGNKCDLPEEQHEVDNAAVDAFCQQHKIPLLKTSAKDNTNVTESFHSLVRECRKYFPNTGTAAGSPGKRRETKKKSGGSKCSIL
ncbi:ras family-domain-containing protein [Fimicolochytrium jonesii]|uniref:ras family-domain-containing protein n=1 Tax=Fimicolochytrium jonesii TaxID=1396493 RepID=UPI0022FF2203|nr:ras family-domain-containing protein [Fimicolochytrium jonesii]XP_052927380.1 ras family-domain-containing protein [Fimicolochytrium jonesii]KAI8819724.1 ras family-domain-containing protein [Fimicolochytrium jonesii]KAI8823198.1 ras family-domain-containing protein [Fimicolochytrium jonesii]